VTMLAPRAVADDAAAHRRRLRAAHMGRVLSRDSTSRGSVPTDSRSHGLPAADLFPTSRLRHWRFGLRVAKVERCERDTRVAEAARLVRRGYGNGAPTTLRRADGATRLARSLVNRPRVLLPTSRSRARSQDPARDGGGAARSTASRRDVRCTSPRRRREARGSRLSDRVVVFNKATFPSGGGAG